MLSYVVQAANEGIVRITELMRATKLVIRIYLLFSCTDAATHCSHYLSLTLCLKLNN